MASSFRTLVKILTLEQSKDYNNDAVIGGFARFARHWAREAHGHAASDEQRQLIDSIVEELSKYDDLQSREERVAVVATLLQQVNAEVAAEEAIAPQTKASRAKPTVDAPGADPAYPQGKHTPDQHAHQQKARRKTQSKARAKAQPKEVRVQAKPPASLRERRGYDRAEKAASETQVASQQGFEAPISTLQGIGPKRAEQFARLGAETVEDLVFFFPHRYDDYSRMKTIDQLTLGDEVTVLGTVGAVNTRRTRRGQSLLEATISDGTAAIRATWFNQSWLGKQIMPGRQIVLSGKVEQYLGRLTMNAPDWEPLERDWLHTGRVVPIYSLTKGINARGMRQIMKGVVDVWAGRVAEYMPLEMLERLDLMNRDDAIAQSHFPDTWEDMQAAHARLAFDELFMLQLVVTQRRLAWQAEPTDPLTVDDTWLEELLGALPYQLTNAQHQALAVIRTDMAGSVPMNRLLQGDVGSGKTVVAAAAMSIALSVGRQAAFMAPTSILADQHFKALDDLLRRAPNGESVNLRLLTGAASESERQEIYAGLADGSVQAIIGTHALIQEGVSFADLALVVIDEQHRFGVRQRGALRSKAATGNPHLLVMTATPIPRTLALTVHADLDLTLIDELPPGRQPVETKILTARERERGYAFIRSQIDLGRQAFIIYPLVEESEKVQAKAAVAEHKRLQEEIFPDLSLGLLHGQMNAADKEEAMNRFYNGESAILVSTSVVEVGIDVPNASVILIEDANRFGLAQLHQFRGRVGRGEHHSYCLLLADSDGASSNGSTQRLRAMEDTSDGFRLAEIDWEMRGAGDLLGVRQSGIALIRFADLMDPRLVESVQREVGTLMEADPRLEAPEHARLAERLEQEVRRQEDWTAGDIS